MPKKSDPAAQSWISMMTLAVLAKDHKTLGELSRFLQEAEQAKQALRDKGYGWTGLSLIDTILEEVPDSKDS